MKLKFVYLLAMMITPVAFSGEQPCADDGGTNIGGSAVGSLAQVASRMPAGGCENGGQDLSKLKGICSVVYDRAEAPAGSGFRYLYEKLIYEASCVSSNDTEAAKKIKIQALWDKYQDKFKCNSNDFDVTDGSILKYSFKIRSFNFFNSALTKWKLNLNYIDPSDNRTILDYVKKELDRNRGTEAETQLQEYYDVLRKSGAKFRAEMV